MGEPALGLDPREEARIGQKNAITRRWARRGTRPRAGPAHAVDLHLRRSLPREGQGRWLVLPYCDTDAMTTQLQEISQAVAPGAHAVLLLDQAGWHLSPKL